MSASTPCVIKSRSLEEEPGVKRNLKESQIFVSDQFCTLYQTKLMVTVYAVNISCEQKSTSLSVIYYKTEYIQLQIIQTRQLWYTFFLSASGGNPDSPVGVGGDSAGGAIAATVCYEVKGISFQVSWERNLRIVYYTIAMLFIYLVIQLAKFCQLY